MTHTHQQLFGRIPSFANVFGRFSLVLLVIGISLVPVAQGAVVWDGEHGTQWWFDPFNWNRDSNNNTTLPPGNATTGVTDTQINTDTSTLPGGEGVVFNPSGGDPNFPPPGSITFPAGFGAQNIRELYVSRQTTAAQSLLTIKGDLNLQAAMQLGRSSNTPGLVATGRVNQLSGTVTIPLNSLDVASTDTSGSVTGENYGNGVYEYRGGVLNVSADGGAGLRLSPSGSVGAAGVGRFIMHNPSAPGYARAYDYNSAAGAGVAARLANGTTTGVGITEFHFENGGTRPVQVPRNLIINNGLTGSGTGAGGIRSSRLQLVLDAAPTVDGNGVPLSLGLFDVAFSDPAGTSTTGTGDLGDFFSSADGSTLYTQGATVSATFAGSTYNWTISYTGNITWAGTVGVDYGNSGQVLSLSDTGGVDVVLKGLSSVIVPQGVPGDYNNNGVVDAADYVLWRNGGPLQNEVDTPGTVNAVDYAAWRARFGNTAGAGASLGGAAVPEPSLCLLMLGGLLAVAARRRRP